LPIGSVGRWVGWPAETRFIQLGVVRCWETTAVQTSTFPEMARNRKTKATGPAVVGTQQQSWQSGQSGQSMQAPPPTTQETTSPPMPARSSLSPSLLLSKSHLRDAISTATSFLSQIPRRLRIFSALRPGHRNEAIAESKPGLVNITENNTTAEVEARCQAETDNSPGRVEGDQAMALARSQKEQQLTPAQSLAISLSRLTVGVQPERVPQPKNLEIKPPNPPDRTPEEKRQHERFTEEALEMVSSRASLLPRSHVRTSS
jgi:hypothetical protein